MKWMRLFGPAAPAAVVLFVALGGCATEPVTGRKQLILLTPAEEMQLGLSEFEKLKKEVPRSKDAAAQALVERVGRRIAAVADLPGAQWEFVLFESPEPNAFCLPGGKVGVYTGILPITRDEAGLATVIGHEVAHALARHGAERMSTGMALQAAGVAVAIAAGGQSAATQQAIMSAYGLGAQVGDGHFGTLTGKPARGRRPAAEAAQTHHHDSRSAEAHRVCPGRAVEPIVAPRPPAGRATNRQRRRSACNVCSGWDGASQCPRRLSSQPRNRPAEPPSGR